MLHQIDSAPSALLADSTLVWIGLTAVAYAIGERLHRSSGRHAAVNPILIAMLLVTLALLALGVPFSTYQRSTAPLGAMLAPAIVALAVVTCDHVATLRAHLRTILIAVTAGGAVGCIAGVVTVKLLAGSPAAVLAVVPRATTGAVSVELSRIMGGPVAVAMLATLLTGIIGSSVGPNLLKRFKIVEERSVGLALGVGSHALGTAKALEIGPIAGAFAAIGLCLNAVLTSFVICLVIRLA
jgi:putative effector of murein hydrolase